LSTTDPAHPQEFLPQRTPRKQKRTEDTEGKVLCYLNPITQPQKIISHKAHKDHKEQIRKMKIEKRGILKPDPPTKKTIQQFLLSLLLLLLHYLLLCSRALSRVKIKSSPSPIEGIYWYVVRDCQKCSSISPRSF
jgi:hypothetical protein